MMGRSRTMCAVAIMAAMLSVGGCADGDTSVGADASIVDQSRTVTPGDSPSPVESSANTPGTDNEDGLAPPPASATPPVQVAASFAAAWVRADLAAEAWWRGVQGWCEPRFAEDLRSVEPANLPARSVTGAPVQVSPPSVDAPGVYSVATDGGTLTVTVAAIGDRWLVSDNDFARTGQRIPTK
jgi:hypothetical protein